MTENQKNELLKQLEDDLKGAGMMLTFSVQNVVCDDEGISADGTTIGMSVDKDVHAILKEHGALATVGDVMADRFVSSVLDCAENHDEYAHFAICLIEAVRKNTPRLLEVLMKKEFPQMKGETYENGAPIKTDLHNPNNKYDA